MTRLHTFTVCVVDKTNVLPFIVIINKIIKKRNILNEFDEFEIIRNSNKTTLIDFFIVPPQIKQIRNIIITIII